MTMKALRSLLLALAALTLVAETTIVANAAVFPSAPAHSGH
jgi:hypothetical protein